jgi:RNA-binding protein
VELTGKQRRYLRSLGHHLKPTLTLGRAGLTDAVLRQIDATLGDLELVKLRFGRGFEDDPKAALAGIVDATGAALAGSVGRTALLYRPREEDPEIRLPRDDGS